MQKIKDRYLTLAAISLLTLTACTSDDLPSADSQEQSGKTPIEVTAGIVGEGSSARTRAVTRRVVTTNDINNNKAVAFEKVTGDLGEINLEN